jgi:hypothetical protein
VVDVHPLATQAVDQHRAELVELVAQLVAERLAAVNGNGSTLVLQRHQVAPDTPAAAPQHLSQPRRSALPTSQARSAKGVVSAAVAALITS